MSADNIAVTVSGNKIAYKMIITKFILLLLHNIGHKNSSTVREYLDTTDASKVQAAHALSLLSQTSTSSKRSRQQYEVEQYRTNNQLTLVPSTSNISNSNTSNQYVSLKN